MAVIDYSIQSMGVIARHHSHPRDASNCWLCCPFVGEGTRAHRLKFADARDDNAVVPSAEIIPDAARTKAVSVGSQRQKRSPAQAGLPNVGW